MGSWAPVYTHNPSLRGGRRKGNGEGEGKAKWKKEIFPPFSPSSPTPFDASQAGYNIPCRYNPLKHIQILQTGLHTLPSKISRETLTKDQSILPLVISGRKIINSSNLSKDDVLMLFGKN